MNTLSAPDLTPGYPSKGKRLGPAWIAMWEAMDAAYPEFLDSHVMADAAAKKVDLSASTLIVFLNRALNRGHLERTHRKVINEKTGWKRNRTFYRIKRDA